MRPDVDDLVVAFAPGDDPAIVQLLLLEHLAFRFQDVLFLGRRNHQVADSERQAGAGRLGEAGPLHAVEQIRSSRLRPNSW